MAKKSTRNRPGVYYCIRDDCTRIAPEKGKPCAFHGRSSDSLFNVQCTAKSKQTKKQCGNPAVQGGTVCYIHGGSAKQVKHKARERLESFVHPALDVFAAILMDIDEESPIKLKASGMILDRTGYHAKTGIETSETPSVDFDSWPARDKAVARKFLALVEKHTVEDI